jgi:16S rRNA A1518/A1519 N6-dimethyltransferase RsmA/KsgA/DIM1 with predicted DNA glycosylase/AP lyase activity
LDTQLATDLQLRYQDTPQVTILNQDALTYSLPQLPQPYYVFANVPFSITARLFEWLFDPATGPQIAHLILQQETITEMSKNHRPQATFKSLLLQPWYEIKLVHRFAKTDFSPAPSVNTALFRFTRRSQSLIPEVQYSAFQDFLAFISHDRVGEGAWLKLFTKKQLPSIATQTKLQIGRGLKSQSLESLIAIYQALLTIQPDYQRYTQGALKVLRREQTETLSRNLAGGHHAGKVRRSTRAR